MDKISREALILKTRREELGLTQMDIAIEAGIQLQQYQRFEYGKRQLSRSNMQLGLRICAILELDPYEFAFENESDWVKSLK